MLLYTACLNCSTTTSPYHSCFYFYKNCREVDSGWDTYYFFFRQGHLCEGTVGVAQTFREPLPTCCRVQSCDVLKWQWSSRLSSAQTAFNSWLWEHVVFITPCFVPTLYKPWSLTSRTSPGTLLLSGRTLSNSFAGHKNRITHLERLVIQWKQLP